MMLHLQVFTTYTARSVYFKLLKSSVAYYFGLGRRLTTINSPSLAGVAKNCEQDAKSLLLVLPAIAEWEKANNLMPHTRQIISCLSIHDSRRRLWLLQRCDVTRLHRASEIRRNNRRRQHMPLTSR